MMRTLTFWMVLVISTGLFAQPSVPERPKITGIDHVVFYTTSPDVNQKLYMNVLGLPSSTGSSTPSEPGQIQSFRVGRQWIGYSPAPDPKSTNRMDHVAFTTESAEALRAYLSSKGVSVPNTVTSSDRGLRSFVVKDPEGNQIEFVERNATRFGAGLDKRGLKDGKDERSDPVSRRLIHAGFLVHDRAAEDHFYKDILGFRPYWHGGMVPERTDWVAMQVPDGTDWLEYMLNVRSNPDQHTLGVMNHISLGVRDMNAAQMKLESHGWKPHSDEHSQIGRDGKLQLNLFDPDQSRIELMEFTPVDKPCCSEFTGPHPSEDDEN
jgi:catechol 2,3-dioxygenase-like lactoylglutathione lyase family enzyme